MYIRHRHKTHQTSHYSYTTQSALNDALLIYEC